MLRPRRRRGDDTDFLDEFIPRIRAAVKDGAYDVAESFEGERPGFACALLDAPPPRIVAEVKPASPTEGTMRAGLDVPATVEGFRGAGACAVSVLATAEAFGGSIANVRAAAGRGVPVLMKDFVLGRTQLAAARGAGASAVLLLAVLDEANHLDVSLADLVHEAQRMGLETVVEATTEKQFEAALGTRADVVGVNARDLRTLEIDMGAALRLISRRGAADRPVLAMSGVRTRADVARMLGAGADAVLVGTSLMQADDPFRKLEDLRR